MHSRSRVGEFSISIFLPVDGLLNIGLYFSGDGVFNMVSNFLPVEDRKEIFFVWTRPDVFCFGRRWDGDFEGGVDLALPFGLGLVLSTGRI